MHKDAHDFNVPVAAEAMQRRQLPNVQLDERNDWWGGATYPGTDRPATLFEVAMKAYCEAYNVLPRE